MKTSVTNYITPDHNTAASVILESPGKVADNIIDLNLGKVYACESNIDVSIYGIDEASYPTPFDFFAIFNVYFLNELTVQFYDDADVLLLQHVFTPADFTGRLTNNLYIDISALTTIDRVRCFTNDPEDYIDKYIGYAWIGYWIDFDCIEKAQPVSLSNDSVQITRSNRPDVDDSYRYRAFDVTLTKSHDYADLREMIEDIQDDGYGRGRPWLLEEPPFNDELYFANLDSGKAGFDLIYFDDADGASGYSAQVTLGIREVM